MTEKGRWVTLPVDSDRLNYNIRMFTKASGFFNPEAVNRMIKANAQKHIFVRDDESVRDAVKRYFGK